MFIVVVLLFTVIATSVLGIFIDKELR